MAKMIKKAYEKLYGLTVRDLVNWSLYAWAAFMSILAVVAWIDNGYLWIDAEEWYEWAMFIAWIVVHTKVLERSRIL